MDNKSNSDMRRRQVPAVTRAISILRQLGKSDEAVGVNQLARELDLIPSTCLHILRALVEGGLVAFDSASKRYSIDIGILPIARSAIHRNNFANLAEHLLTRLSERYGVTAVATQISDPKHMVVVALSQTPVPFRLQVDLGSQFPILISATGRCYAAFTPMTDAQLKRQFDTLHWERPPQFDQWLTAVEETREHGYAVDRGAYINGVTIIAVPFFGQSRYMTHSLVAIGISEKMEATGVDLLAHEMVKSRDELTSLLIGSKNDSASNSVAFKRSKNKRR